MAGCEAAFYISEFDNGDRLEHRPRQAMRLGKKSTTCVVGGRLPPTAAISTVQCEKRFSAGVIRKLVMAG